MEYCHGGNLPSKEYFNISLVCKIWRSYSIGSIKSIKLVPQHMENLLIPYKPRVLEEAIKSIQQIIVNGISLESIDFSNGELDLQRMRHLTDSLKLNSTIRHLNFQYCYLDSESVELLAQVLSVNRSIQHLDLSYNKITHSGALCLAKSILNNHILQSMDLSNNEIGNQGALAISEILILNKSTVKINLSQNQIGGDGYSVGEVMVLVMGDNGGKKDMNNV
ncbi:hypothetical protein DLAC_00059 [Tieghemostelium lacteum]|uniref:Leucine-rich repeat-containing protein (LRR) n=1 Tax=Tieghemostelium lacteum TaxID=361077 RepID=A0A152A8S3_TIELA|nr:hypothetical protein DLAC_00059 [Tieghemostelium lacteum]|eukprot:KYR02612.1 hypothetical protein DLAC_00059 [Tieghemostelium lacteum]